MIWHSAHLLHDLKVKFFASLKNFALSLHDRLDILDRAIPTDLYAYSR